MKFLVIHDLTPIPDQALIVVHGICIGIAAAFLFSGHKPRLAAAIVALLLTLIELDLAMHGLQFIGELLRNIVLLGSALVLMADPVIPPKLIWVFEDNQKKVQDESETQNRDSS